MSTLPMSTLEQQTRMIAMGSSPLMEGFALLGFETWPNANNDDLENLLSELMESDDEILLLLETYLSQSQSSQLSNIRNHGGKIIVTEVPAINAARDYHPFVEDLLTKLLGAQVLEESS
jgi:vacuolar-type H+-ATPase subunit F/Vma7